MRRFSRVAIALSKWAPRLSVTSASIPSLAFVLLAACSSTATAQLPNPDVRALGMAGNQTAVARGRATVRWNPALLGFGDGERLTLALAPVTLNAGIGPVTWKDTGPFDNDTVPASERERWLQLIEREGAVHSGGAAEVTYLSGSFGRYALQVSSVASARSEFGPGVAELFLFGNVGRTGQPCTCPLTGTELDAHVVSTVAASAGFGLPELLGGQAAAGVTLKYSVGHAFVHGSDAGGTLGPGATIDVTFPLVMTDSAASDFGNTGSGVGLDVGFALRRNDITFGASLQNLVQTFGWDESQLVYREARAVLSRQAQLAEADREPFANAPASLREFVEGHTFPRVLSLGVGLDPKDDVTVAADLRARLGDEGMDTAPGFQVGAGGEWRWSVLAVRAGAAVLSGGYQIGGGLGLSLGPTRAGFSLLHRDTDSNTDIVGMLTVFSLAF
jgi:hypothetical protein